MNCNIFNEGKNEKTNTMYRRRDEAEVDLNIMRIKRRASNGQRPSRKLYWKPRPTTDCSALGGEIKFYIGRHKLNIRIRFK
jgi:hypothetical protein